MQRRHPSEEFIIHTPGRASEYSVPFSDLRADTDTRLLRLWLDTELEPDGSTWSSIDIARGGRSISTKLETAEHNNTRQNSELLQRLSLAAFALYQPERLTDDDGNLIAIALPRNSRLLLGQSPRDSLSALRGSALAPNHLGLYVDNDDNLAIEAYELDNLPQIEVIASDSEAAVHTGQVARGRDYLRPRETSVVGDVVIYQRGSLPDLTSNVRAIAPQFHSNIAIPTTILSEEIIRIT